MDAPEVAANPSWKDAPVLLGPVMQQSAHPPDFLESIDSQIQQSTQRIFGAFTEGAKAGFGNAPIATPATALSPETEASLKKAGIFNDYTKEAQSADAALLEAGVRGAAATLQLAGRGLSAVLGGGLQATGQAIESTGAVPKGELTGEEGLAGAATDPFLAMFIGPEAELAAAAKATRLRAIETEIQKGRALGTVGEGETGFHDVVPPTPENLQARTEAAGEAGIPVPKPAEPPATIHDLARQIEPEAFQKYDAAAVEKDTQRQKIQALAAERENLPEAVEAQNTINEILGKVRGVEERLTKKAAERLAEAQDRLDTILRTDSPEMANARQALQDADIAQRDLVPTVAAAYRQAREITPDEVAAKPEEPPAHEATPPAEVKPEEPPSLPPNIAEKLEAPKAEPIEAAPQPTAEGKQPAGEGAKTTIRTVPGLRPIEGTGELKTRGLAQSAEASAIGKGLVETFGDLPEYRTVDFDAMLEKVAQYAKERPEDAMEIAMGRKAAPKGTLPNAFFVAVKDAAEKAGDVDTARELATNSKLLEQATTKGQDIAILARIDKSSPTGAMLDVQKAREADLARRSDVKDVTDATVKEIKTEIKNAASRSEAWSQFVNSILCAE